MEVIEHTPIPIADIYSAANHDYPRHPGWHVTGLMDVIESSLGRTVDYSGLSPDVPEMGKLWEWSVKPYLMAWARELGWWYDPVTIPYMHDEITASLDGVFRLYSHDSSLRSIRGVVEVKLKFSPRPLDPTTNRRWMTQVKAYCKVVGTCDVYMLVGRTGTRPPFMGADRHVIRFTQDEIDQTWEQLLGARGYAAGKGIEPPEGHV